MKKTVSVWNGSVWTDKTEKFFVYDGWNLIEEITEKNAALTSKYYVWGLDLSRTPQGAGGIGGLLASSDKTSSDVYYYLYDANGNVGQLVSSADGTIAAHYEYDPFGNVTFKDGSEADNNAFQFSTKFFDAETGMYYYGFRHYMSEIGRWKNRYPVGELGSINLYANGKDFEKKNGGINMYEFVWNNPANRFDYLGLVYELIDFPDDETEDIIREAIRSIINLIYNSPNPFCIQEKEFKDSLLRKLAEIKIIYSSKPPKSNICADALVDGNRIRIYKKTLDRNFRSCKPVPSILLHELVHTLGYREELVPCSCEAACFKETFYQSGGHNVCLKITGGGPLCACNCRWNLPKM